MKITKVRDEQKTVGIPDLRHSRYATRMTQIERQLTVLCEPCHARGYGWI